ncbi:hypothetical protein PROP_02347 [Propionicimonas sp. T2.31MG-18]|uniref:FG-GAP repeat domain-containing protein n=1 Tax=Propionicimonas sp. T2.31MG-18 TaxID=3157620 RepID=UPI0035EB9949
MLARTTTVVAAVLALAACTPVPSPSSTGPALPSVTAATPASSPATVRSAASPDFDGDGLPDLAVGVGEPAARVHVRYGAGRTQDLTRPGLDGASSYGFGQSLLAGDLDGDGYADLVVADADESFGQPQALFVLRGSASGLEVGAATRVVTTGLAVRGALALVTTPERILAVSGYDATGGVVRLFGLGADGLPVGEPRTLGAGPSDGFGEALAASGPVLVIGAPGRAVAGARAAGAVTVLRFLAGGTYDEHTYTQESPGIPGTPQAGDRFGASVAAGDGHVVVGVPNDHDASAVGGRVQPFRIVGAELSPLPSMVQGDGVVPGRPEPGDAFGWTLAVLRVCPGVPGVLVGAPGEAIGSRPQAGSAWLLPLANGCQARQVYDRATGLGDPVEGAVVGSAVGALRRDGGSADTPVVVAQGNSEEGVWGRVLTLGAPGQTATVVMSDLRLGDDRDVVVTSAAG